MPPVNYNTNMSWPQKLVFLNGKLQREGTDYIFIHERILFKNVKIGSKDEITILYITGHRVDHGDAGLSLDEILDPAQKRV